MIIGTKTKIGTKKLFIDEKNASKGYITNYY